MADIPDVDIDAHGKFKYILIEVEGKGPNTSMEKKLIVRGYADCAYHADIFDKVEAAIGRKDVKFSCPGGGRILHNSDAKTLKVFGYSQGYGKADHEKTVEILKRHYTDYNITWSDDGY